MTTRKPKPPDPPRHLSRASAKWWKDVVTSVELEEHHLHLLRLACEAFDRCQEARETLAKTGTVYQDRFGAPKMRPEVLIERDSRLAFVKTLRELGLDLVAPGDEARPPGVVGKSAVDDDEEDEV